MGGWGASDFMAVLAGLGGAIVYAILQPDRDSWMKTLASVVVGFMAALFGAPWLCEWRGWDTVPAQHAVAFGTGLLGNPICRMCLTRYEAIVNWFMKRNGGDGQEVVKRPKPDSDPTPTR
jgi:hypothetical protein